MKKKFGATYLFFHFRSKWSQPKSGNDSSSHKDNSVFTSYHGDLYFCFIWLYYSD